MHMSEGGIAFERYSQYQKEVKITSQWGAEEWARYPDIYDNYKKWSALRAETWDEEMKTLEVLFLKNFNYGFSNFQKIF